MNVKTLLLGAAASLALAPAAYAERGEDGHLNIIYWQAPSTLNPFLSGGTKEVESSSMIIEPLIRFNEKGEMVPMLVDEIPTVENGGVSEDLKSITYKLKEGVKWSDGTDFTAEDAVFTWEYCTHPDSGCAQASYFDGVASVEAPDPLTVVVNFKEAKPFPYTAFVGSESPILQKAQFQDCLGASAPECTDANFGPIGTGPFVVDEFKPNDVISLSANPNYRDADKPAFATITFKGGGDAAAAARAVLETGEFDYAWNLQLAPEVLADMEAKGNGKVVVAFGTSVERLHMNQTNPDPSLGPDKRSVFMNGENAHPFLTDPRVGKALSMAIDRQAIIDNILLNGTPADDMVAPVIQGYRDGACGEACEFDPEAAKELFDSAGGYDGTLNIWFNAGAGHEEVYQAVANMWEQNLGITDVAFETPQFAELLEQLEAEGMTGPYRLAWVMDYPSMQNYLGPLLACDGSSNYTGYCNEEADEFVAQGNAAASVEEATSLYQQADDLHLQELPVIPFYYRNEEGLYSESVSNVTITPFAQVDLPAVTVNG